jgi:hypothetical protein
MRRRVYRLPSGQTAEEHMNILMDTVDRVIRRNDRLRAEMKNVIV